MQTRKGCRELGQEPVRDGLSELVIFEQRPKVRSRSFHFRRVTRLADKSPPQLPADALGALRPQSLGDAETLCGLVEVVATKGQRAREGLAGRRMLQEKSSCPLGRISRPWSPLND